MSSKKTLILFKEIKIPGFIILFKILSFYSWFHLQHTGMLRYRPGAMKNLKPYNSNDL